MCLTTDSICVSMKHTAKTHLDGVSWKYQPPRNICHNTQHCIPGGAPLSVHGIVRQYAAAYLLDCTITEDMATAADGYKRVASAVKVRDRANEALGCLCICCSGLKPKLVTLFCQMYSENIPVVQTETEVQISDQQAWTAC